MNISLIPHSSTATKCLVLVGGDGDGVEVLSTLSNMLSQGLPDYQICSFDFTEESSTRSVLDIQSIELQQVLQHLIDLGQFERVDIWCTSRGAYATTRLLGQPYYSDHVSYVIMYDPADYYIAESNLHSWAGYENYEPTLKVISDEIKDIKGDYLVDVVHLSLKNHGPKGYWETDYAKRGINHEGGYPRINSEMVRSFYDKLPVNNKGRYILENSIPHGFVRDGDIGKNYELLTKQLVDMILQANNSK